MSQSNWDLSLFHSRLSSLPNPTDKPLCVLLTTGALSPVHRGHVLMMKQAADFLSSSPSNYQVVCGYLSPSNDLYVGPKARSKGTFFVNARHRIEMTDLLIREMEEEVKLEVGDSGWLGVGTWEASQERYWPDFPEVLGKLSADISSSCAHNVTVFYVCGADHARLCGGGFGGETKGLVVIPRDSKCIVRSKPEKKVFVAPVVEETDGLSSTGVRKEFQNKNFEQVRKLVGVSVVDHILKNGLFGYRPMSSLRNEGPSSSSSSSSSCFPFSSSPSPSSPPVIKYIFISATSLFREWISPSPPPTSALSSAILFFGSKRCWLFPKTHQQIIDAQNQPSFYPKMWDNKPFMAFLRQKESQNQLHFLKRDDLCYTTYPGPPDPEAYNRVSQWLTSLSLSPLKLDKEWWEKREKGDYQFISGAQGSRVVQNFQNGFHDYGEVMELLVASNPEVIPLNWWRDVGKFQKRSNQTKMK